MKQKKVEIVDKEEADQYMLDNPYLHGGYRKNFTKKRQALKSLCMKHNEVTHIWTHLIGALLFLALIVFLISQRNQYTKIYNEVKKDFMNFHIDKFDDIFKKEINYFINQLKIQKEKQSQNLNDIHQKSSEFFGRKFDEYLNGLKLFKNSLTNEKSIHQDKLELYLDSMLLQKYEFYKKFIDINHQELNVKNDHEQHVDKVFNQEKQKILQELKILADLEYYPIYIYILSAFLCLGFSATYHTFSPLSKKVNDVLQRLDMAGISILIFGSCFASSFYLYHCEGWLQLFYMSVQFITCFGAFVATLFEKFHKEEFTYIKGLIFGALGLGNGLSIFHAFYIFRIRYQVKDFDPVFIGAVIMGTLYLTGLFFYIKKIPERYWPKKFDIWFNSHTIFHIFVFVAAVQYYFTLEFLYQKRVENVCKSIVEHYHQLIQLQRIFIFKLFKNQLVILISLIFLQKVYIGLSYLLNSFKKFCY